MKKYYCDGSQHMELHKLGIGIVTEDLEEEYIEIEDFNWRMQTYEIHAITNTIKKAIAEKSKSIVVINDDRGLVESINRAFSSKKKYKSMINKSKYRSLIELIETHNVKVRTPESLEEKRHIKRAHDLSRTYLNKRR